MIELRDASIPEERVGDEPVFGLRPFGRVDAADCPAVGAWLEPADDTATLCAPAEEMYWDDVWGLLVVMSPDIWRSRKPQLRDRIVGCGLAIKDATYLELATAFSAYLARHRSTSPPEIGEKRSAGGITLTIPHFVLTRRNAELSDAVLWENPTHDTLYDVFSTDTRGIEKWWPRVGGILELRSQLRRAESGFPEVDALRDVMRAQRRYLSSKFIIEHADLVESALIEIA